MARNFWREGANFAVSSINLKDAANVAGRFMLSQMGENVLKYTENISLNTPRLSPVLHWSYP
jgi:hypothetical protein